MDADDLALTQKGPLSVADKQQRRINQFTRSNPKLAAALARRQSDDANHALSDIQEVSQYLLDKVIALATKDPESMDEEKAGNALRFVRAEEMHQAKLGKLKADTEAVLINVATPTAIRKIVNDFGMAIKTGLEEAVMNALAQNNDTELDEEKRDLICQIGESIYRQQMIKIQEGGYTDDSWSRAMEAPR